MYLLNFLFETQNKTNTKQTYLFTNFSTIQAKILGKPEDGTYRVSKRQLLFFVKYLEM